MRDAPSDQMQLPLGSAADSQPEASPESAVPVDEQTKLIRFEDALKVHQESQRRDAIRRILTIREDIQEG